MGFSSWLFSFLTCTAHGKAGEGQPKTSTPYRRHTRNVRLAIVEFQHTARPTVQAKHDRAAALMMRRPTSVPSSVPVLLLLLLLLSLLPAPTSPAFAQKDEAAYLALFDDITAASYSQPRPAGLTTACVGKGYASPPTTVVSVTGNKTAAEVQALCSASDVCVVEKGATLRMSSSLVVGALEVKGTLTWVSDAARCITTVYVHDLILSIDHAFVPHRGVPKAATSRHVLAVRGPGAVSYAWSLHTHLTCSTPRSFSLSRSAHPLPLSPTPSLTPSPTPLSPTPLRSTRSSGYALLTRSARRTIPRTRQTPTSGCAPATSPWWRGAPSRCGRRRRAALASGRGCTSTKHM